MLLVLFCISFLSTVHFELVTAWSIRAVKGGNTEEFSGYWNDFHSFSCISNLCNFKLNFYF